MQCSHSHYYTFTFPLVLVLQCSLHITVGIAHCSEHCTLPRVFHTAVSIAHCSESFTLQWVPCIAASIAHCSEHCTLQLVLPITLQALEKYTEELEQDPIIKSHLETLYDKLLEGNLLRIIEPYSHVQVPHVAKLINLNKVCAGVSLSITLKRCNRGLSGLQTRIWDYTDITWWTCNVAQ